MTSWMMCSGVALDSVQRSADDVLEVLASLKLQRPISG